MPHGWSIWGKDRWGYQKPCRGSTYYFYKWPCPVSLTKAYRRPKHTEAIAIREGLRVADRFDFTAFFIQSDCKIVVNQLHSSSGKLGPIRHSFDQIMVLLDRLQVLVVFVRQLANYPTHVLVGVASSTYPSYIWMGVIPHVILPAIQANIS